MAGFFWFSDDQWSRIEPLLPVNGKGARRVDDRRVLSGIAHALQCGGRWGASRGWQAQGVVADITHITTAAFD